MFILRTEESSEIAGAMKDANNLDTVAAWQVEDEILPKAANRMKTHADERWVVELATGADAWR